MELVRASVVLAVSTAVRMAANLVVIKVMAVVLGTEGVGLVGQFMSVVAVTTAIAGGGIALGVTRHVSQQGSSGQEAASYLRAAAIIWFASGLLFAATAVLLAPQLSTLLLGTASYAGIFRAVALCQFVIGAGNLLTAVISGRHDVRGLAAVQMLTAVIGAAVTSSLMLAGGLAGAMWGLLLAPCLGMLLAAVRVTRKSHLPAAWMTATVGMRHYHDLLRYAAMLVVTVCTMPIAQIVLRNWQADALGWEQAGIWQGLVKLSDAWLQFAMLVLSSWYFPRLSRAASHGELHSEFRRTFILTFAAMVPAAVLIWTIRSPLVTLLFSPDFHPMTDLLAAQLFGDVCRTLACVVSFIVVAKANTRLYAAAEIFQAGVVLLLSHALLPDWGAGAVPFAYMATSATYCVICLAAYSHYHLSQRAVAA